MSTVAGLRISRSVPCSDSFLELAPGRVAPLPPLVAMAVVGWLPFAGIFCLSYLIGCRVDVDAALDDVDGWAPPSLFLSHARPATRSPPTTARDAQCPRMFDLTFLS